jgi:hypothetical protein
MSIASRMVRMVPVALLALVAQGAFAADAPLPWAERNGTYLLPEQNGAQLALVAMVYPANHRVLYGFRETPQRANCAPGSVSRGQTLDVEGVRILFSRECVRGVFTLIPVNVPSKRAFASILSRVKTLHLRTASFFPLTYDVSTLPVVSDRLEVLAAERRSRVR